MAVYAIGDLQGCYDELMRLLDHIGFSEASDTLWFCGDTQYCALGNGIFFLQD